jgi:hypothetical protein
VTPQWLQMAHKTRLSEPRAREHVLRRIAAARKALVVQARAGRDPRASAQAGHKRGEANAEPHPRNHRWAREHPGQRDEAWFKREIVPKLDLFSLKEIAHAAGLSFVASSRIRAGARVPRARHWEALRELTEA